MTIRVARLALATALVILIAPSVATAQFGRGGMVGNRGNFAGGNRPSIGINPNINRQNFNQNNFNRQNINNNVGIRQNSNTVVNNITNVVSQNNVNNRPGIGRPGYGYGGGFGGTGNYGGYRGWGGTGAVLGGFGGGYQANSYYAAHSNWVNGSFGGNYRPGWGGYPGFGGPNNGALGAAAAVGIAAWGVGSLVNSFGYSRYSNPYYNPAATGYVQQSLYDYSRPLDLASAPAQSVVQTSVASFDQARDLFMVGDYLRALAMADKALLQTPNDPMLHEFRAICLFGLRRFDEAAVPLYTVLSAGPGWDWTTLVGLYPSMEVYTSQLRALEAYCNASPRAASARFVLATLYLTQGNGQAAATRFREVVALQPQDRLSAQLLAAMTTEPTRTVATATNPSEVPPANSTQGASLPTGPVPANLFGPWTATPQEGVVISLNLERDGKAFTWKVVEKGTSREFRGEATADPASNVLALLTQEMPPMVARVTWKGASEFNFRVIGTPSEDPGLNFSR